MQLIDSGSLLYSQFASIPSEPICSQKFAYTSALPYSEQDTPLDSFSYPDVVPEVSNATTEDEHFGANEWVIWDQGPRESTSPIVKHTMNTLLRVMKTWPKMLAKGFQTPPMIHFSHLDPDNLLPSLASCITVARMWVNQSEGASEIIRRTVIRELQVISNR